MVSRKACTLVVCVTLPLPATQGRSLAHSTQQSLPKRLAPLGGLVSAILPCISAARLTQKTASAAALAEPTVRIWPCLAPDVASEQLADHPERVLPDVHRTLEQGLRVCMHEPLDSVHLLPVPIPPLCGPSAHSCMIQLWFLLPSSFSPFQASPGVMCFVMRGM